MNFNNDGLSAKNKATHHQNKANARLPRRYKIVIWFFAFISLLGFGFGLYSFLTMPGQVHRYVNAHKEELRGEKGDIGPQGFSGVDGRDGNSGASYLGGFRCHTYTIGGLSDDQYTNCY